MRLRRTIQLTTTTRTASDAALPQSHAADEQSCLSISLCQQTGRPTAFTHCVCKGVLPAPLPVPRVPRARVLGGLGQCRSFGYTATRYRFKNGIVWRPVALEYNATTFDPHDFRHFHDSSILHDYSPLHDPSYTHDSAIEIATVRRTSSSSCTACAGPVKNLPSRQDVLG